MKPCRGCKHWNTGSICRVRTKWEYRFDPYAGGPRWMATAHPLGDLVEHMRAADGPCGPDAVLYSPRFWRRVWRWVIARIKGFAPSQPGDGEGAR